MFHSNTEDKFLKPKEYHGPLYSPVDSKKYLLRPIRIRIKSDSDKRMNTGFYVVFTEDSDEIIDVIARITNNHHTKCIKKDSSQMESSSSSSSSSGETNGYQCGHDFLSNDILIQSLIFAREKMGLNLRYPARYTGSLFSAEIELMIWPILSRGLLYKSGKSDAGPYYIVIDNQGGFREVVVRGFQNNFLRCIRTRKAPQAPASDPLNRLFVPGPRYGYSCNKVFFDNNYLEKAAEVAKDVFNNRKKIEKVTLHHGDPFNEPFYLWPILTEERLYRKGNPGPYWVALNTKYEIIGATMMGGNLIKKCEKIIFTGKKNHDTSDYLCVDRIFSSNDLIRAADEACKKMKSRNRTPYPAKYQGPDFESEGPYLTYPAFKNGIYYHRAGPDRVVINSNCEVVGAITKLQYHSIEILVKCYRIGAGPKPTEMPINTSEEISEHLI
ncbi:putative guanyl-specific ribonuclease f1 [Erysiphe necator]|uniref:Putative guanyl-specific ribonuclease f1 n=1 Tax=Uncinula necator TaxID=52586 RepID=A0A0B1P344_UNCNE|nr:putative guanyl-specific ribonuclease f1 [Erysiphe necator]